jgi:membrane protease YdiL (CAAX protease family)
MSLLFRIPGTVLIFRLIDRESRKQILLHFGRPVLFFAAFSGLTLAGFGIALAARFSGLYPGVPVIPPTDAASWILVILQSFTIGYLEESYFRWYLPLRFRETGFGIVKSYFFSIFLFSLCHVYEGPWGVANAALAGTLLSFVFFKSRSIHCIALAHGLYNVLVYALSIFTV